VYWCRLRSDLSLVADICAPLVHLFAALFERRFDEGSGADSSDNDNDTDSNSDNFTGQRTAAVAGRSCSHTALLDHSTE
jgi:hypothetical protein